MVRCTDQALATAIILSASRSWHQLLLTTLANVSLWIVKIAAFTRQGIETLHLQTRILTPYSAAAAHQCECERELISHFQLMLIPSTYVCYEFFILFNILIFIPTCRPSIEEIFRNWEQTRGRLLPWNSNVITTEQVPFPSLEATPQIISLNCIYIICIFVGHLSEFLACIHLGVYPVFHSCRKIGKSYGQMQTYFT